MHCNSCAILIRLNLEDLNFEVVEISIAENAGILATNKSLEETIQDMRVAFKNSGPYEFLDPEIFSE